MLRWKPRLLIMRDDVLLFFTKKRGKIFGKMWVAAFGVREVLEFQDWIDECSSSFFLLLPSRWSDALSPPPRRRREEGETGQYLGTHSHTERGVSFPLYPTFFREEFHRIGFFCLVEIMYTNWISTSRQLRPTKCLLWQEKKALLVGFLLVGI